MTANGTQITTLEKWRPTLKITYHNLCPVRLYLGWNKRQRECTSCQCEGVAAHKEPRICPQHIGRHAQSRRTCTLGFFTRRFTSLTMSNSEKRHINPTNMTAITKNNGTFSAIRFTAWHYLHFCRLQPDISLQCKTKNTGLVHQAWCPIRLQF